MLDPSHTPLERVKAFFELLENFEGHDSILLSCMEPISASYDPTPAHPHNAKATYVLTVPSSLCNMSGSLHGGAVALVFDWCTSVTIYLCAKEGFWEGHVSRSLNCTYFRPAKMGQKVVVECQVVHLGKRQGVVTGVIKGGEGEDNEGKVLYTCEHGKAAVGASSL